MLLRLPLPLQETQKTRMPFPVDLVQTSFWLSPSSPPLLPANNNATKDGLSHKIDNALQANRNQIDVIYSSLGVHFLLQNGKWSNSYLIEKHEFGGIILQY